MIIQLILLCKAQSPLDKNAQFHYLPLLSFTLMVLSVQGRCVSQNLLSEQSP